MMYINSYEYWLRKYWIEGANSEESDISGVAYPLEGSAIGTSYTVQEEV